MSKIRISLSTIMTLILVSLFSIVASAAAAPNAGIPVVTSSNSVLLGQDYTLTWTKNGSNNVDNYKIIWDGGDVVTLDNATLSYTVTAPSLGVHRYEIWAAATTNGDSQHYRGTVEVVKGDKVVKLPESVNNEIGNDGNPMTHNNTHGNFQNNTASCANCHSAHNGGNDMLLKYQSTELDMCMSCHDGTMGFYNVEVESSAGVFDFDGSHKSSSMHNVRSDVKIGQAPGAVTNVSTGELECSSCHNPHGSVNDRLISEKVQTGAGTTTTVAWAGDANIGVKQIALNLIEDPAYADFNASTSGIKIMKAKGASTSTEITNYSKFCASCHDSYFASRSGGKVTKTTDPLHGYTHSTNSGSAGRNCASCHYSHGTSIDTMKDSAGLTVADYVAKGWDQTKAEAYMENVTGTYDKTTNGYTTNPSSALKKYTNNAVCLACHAKDVATPGVAGADYNGKPAK
ncbi:hypothetical protein J1P26_17050 [Neobacillus sp. MM2021_6]|uniref:cytochrome c3 family protein n=1 Tax=Bacillaceae TaxID=186817 RepID=UPI00140E338E|nr:MULTISPECIES: cytochrome c3 family protein [Bacillaceae]MBO0961416.1 hypothetical protein [Neobacillus sp. MM2021_6]NHC19520.1 hypothetical protein [Bacillus sp. MM2020_4]